MWTKSTLHCHGDDWETECRPVITVSRMSLIYPNTIDGSVVLPPDSALMCPYHARAFTEKLSGLLSNSQEVKLLACFFHTRGHNSFNSVAKSCSDKICKVSPLTVGYWCCLMFGHFRKRNILIFVWSCRCLFAVNYTQEYWMSFTLTSLFSALSFHLQVNYSCTDAFIIEDRICWLWISSVFVCWIYCLLLLQKGKIRISWKQTSTQEILLFHIKHVDYWSCQCCLKKNELNILNRNKQLTCQKASLHQLMGTIKTGKIVGEK